MYGDAKTELLDELASLGRLNEKLADMQARHTEEKRAKVVEFDEKRDRLRLALNLLSFTDMLVHLPTDKRPLLHLVWDSPDGDRLLLVQPGAMTLGFLAWDRANPDRYGISFSLQDDVDTRFFRLVGAHCNQWIMGRGEEFVDLGSSSYGHRPRSLCGDFASCLQTECQAAGVRYLFMALRPYGLVAYGFEKDCNPYVMLRPSGAA